MTALARHTALLGAVAVLVGAGQSGGAPPGPLTPRLESLRAVALGPGALFRAASVSAEQSDDFAAGAVFDYFGATVDTFGRDWHIVGAPSAWVREDGWYAIPARPTDPRPRSTNLSLLTSLPMPQVSLPSAFLDDDAAAAVMAGHREPLRVAAGWWDEVIDVDSTYLPEFGETLGVRAYKVPRGVAREAIELIGGRARLAPWPDEPGFGRLHVAAVLPFVFRFDGEAWELGDQPVSLAPVLSLLSNPGLVADRQAAATRTGLVLPCWSLIGGLDPRGTAAGRLDEAAPAPTGVAAGVRRETDKLLGLANLTALLSPTVPETMRAPRRLVPEVEEARGVALNDNSQRQAVYLEQSLNAVLVDSLRGRTVRLSVRARAIPVGETTASATVGVEIAAGTVLGATSATVGSLATDVTLEVVIPEDATDVVVRLLPLDRSIAVSERGGAILERVSLVPVEWPDRLVPVPLLLRRVRVVTYSPALRYTRAPLVVGDRPASALRAVWQELSAGDWSAEQREAILAGQLAPAMSRDEVRLAWGEPETKQVTSALERWDYEGRSAAFDLEAGLISWTRDAEIPKSEAEQCAVTSRTVTASIADER